MSTITATLTLAGDKSGIFDLPAGQTASYSVAGTWTGSVALEKAEEGRAGWRAVGTLTEAGSGTLLAAGQYRWRLVAIGEEDDPLTVTLADAVDAIEVWRDHDGNVVATLDEDNLTVPTLITELVITDDIVLPADGAIFIGPADEVGTWRIIRSGDDLAFERLETVVDEDVWVEKLLAEAAP